MLPTSTASFGKRVAVAPRASCLKKTVGRRSEYGIVLDVQDIADGITEANGAGIEEEKLQQSGVVVGDAIGKEGATVGDRIPLERGQSVVVEMAGCLEHGKQVWIGEVAAYHVEELGGKGFQAGAT